MPRKVHRGRNKRTGRGRKNGRTRNRMGANPRPFESTLTISKTFRFVQTGGAGTSNIGVKDIQDLLVMAATTVSAYRLTTAFNIKRVSMWGPMAEDLIPVTVSLQWQPDTGSSFGGPARIVSDTSMGSNRAAKIQSTPPRESFQSRWLSYDVLNDPLFEIIYPANAILDIQLQMVMQNAQTPVASAYPISGAIAGQIYVRPLDGAALGTWIPVSYVSL
jgi:hypothetical protein